MMNQVLPNPSLAYYPCSIVAVSTAKKQLTITTDIKKDGYLTLKNFNRFIRANMSVEKYVYYKRTERKPLKEFHFDGKAMVLVLGHCIYVDKDNYYSFFNNDDDMVVAIWYLKGEQ